MEELIIRNVTKEDIYEVSELIVASWKTAFRGMIDDDFLDNMTVEETYERKMKNYPENEFIVAVKENEIVGFCRYTIDNVFSRECRRIDCELCALHIKPNMKRRGIGRALMNYAIQDLKKHNKKRMILWCLKDNINARKFYEKMGGRRYKRSKLEKGNKKYKLVGYRYDLKEF